MLPLAGWAREKAELQGMLGQQRSLIEEQARRLTSLESLIRDKRAAAPAQAPPTPSPAAPSPPRPPAAAAASPARAPKAKASATTTAPKRTEAPTAASAAQLQQAQWQFEKDRLLLEERIKREDKEREIVRLEKELELAKEQRREVVERLAREEAAAAKVREEEKERARRAELATFERESALQERVNADLEREIAALRTQQRAADEAEQQRAAAQREAAAKNKQANAYAEHLALLSECRRLEQAKENRQRKLTSQHLNAARADILLQKKGVAGGVKVDPDAVDGQTVASYLRFVDALDREQKKLLRQSGWGQEDIRRLEEVELTRRQLQSAGLPLESMTVHAAQQVVTQRQLHDLAQVERWQKWHIDSDNTLRAAASFCSDGGASAGGGGGLIAAAATSPVSRPSLAAGGGGGGPALSPRGQLTAEAADAFLEGRNASGAVGSTKSWLAKAIDAVSGPVTAPPPLPAHVSPPRGTLVGASEVLGASPIPHAPPSESTATTPGAVARSIHADISAVDDVMMLQAGGGGTGRAALPSLSAYGAPSSLAAAAGAQQENASLGLGAALDHIVNEVYRPNQSMQRPLGDASLHF
eukprot:Rhum_TRINITY_DN14636_c1_g1::Rhum_TRINITY_DN14636_c1_g1_i1::g.104639::m.104639